MLKRAEPAAEETDKPITEYPFFRELCALPFVEIVYVYGSRALGTAEERSDWDLAVLCPRASEDDWKELQKILRNAPFLLRINAVRLDTLDNKRFLTLIHKQKKPLYIKDESPHEWLDYARIIQEKIVSLRPALARLEAQAARPFSPEESNVQALMGDFNFAFGSTWRMLQRALAIHGARAPLPLLVFRDAYAAGWISNRPQWERMVEDYTQLLETRTPISDAAIKAHKHMPAHVALMRDAAKSLSDIIAPYLRKEAP